MHQVGKKENLEIDFTVIFRRYEANLFKFAFRLTKSENFAQDVVQDVFLSLWRHMDQINEIDNIESWLFKATENKVIDFFRKSALDQRIRDAIWTNMQMKSTSGMDQYLERKEFHMLIRRAIDALPEQRRLVYLLHRDEDLSYKEIAEKLNISHHTVKNHLSAAVKSIREYMKRFLSFF